MSIKLKNKLGLDKVQPLTAEEVITLSPTEDYTRMKLVNMTYEIKENYQRKEYYTFFRYSLGYELYLADELIKLGYNAIINDYNIMVVMPSPSEE